MKVTLLRMLSLLRRTHAYNNRLNANPHRSYCHSAGNLFRAGKFSRAGRTFRASTPVCPGIPRSYLPDSGILPARFPLALPWLFPNVIPHVYPERAGIPKLEGGCHSSLGSSGDISISHSGVSRGHRNVPHTSVSHYTTSPDSSGPRRPRSRTLLHYDGSFPSRPTPRSERLVCATPAHLRTISLYGSSAHNNVTEPVYESTHGTLPTQINPTTT